MNKTKWLCSLAIITFLGFVAWPVVARRRENERRSVRGQQLTAALHKTKEWQSRARLFDHNKRTAAAVFAGATKVQAFRLFPNGSERLLGKTQNFDYFATGATQGKPFATRLAAIVLDAKTYSWPGQSTKQCSFEPGVAFRVWQEAKFVDTIICFHCSQLAVLENNPQVPQRSIGGSLEGRFYVAGDFDVARPQLLSLAQEALPDDGAIQAMR